MSQPQAAIVNNGGVVAFVGRPAGAAVAFVPYETVPTPGSVWYYQGQPYDSPSEVPNANDGDTFVNTDSWDVFAYWDGYWVFQGTLQGPPGTPITTGYELVEASSWTTEHNYPYMPAVRLVEGQSQSDVATSIEYPTPTSVHITFPEPWTGTVYLT